MLNKNGFTLVELLVVVAIIGILASVAIPQFSTYRMKAGNATAKSDLRNVVSAEEAYYSDHIEYTTFTCSNHTITAGSSLGISCSKNVTVTTSILSSSTRWTGRSNYIRGSTVYSYDTRTSKIE